MTLPTEPVHPTSLGAALALQQALQRQQQRTAQAQGMDAPGAAEATLHHTLSRALRQLEAALPPPMPSQQAQQQQVRQQQQQGGSRRSSLDGPAPPLDWLQLGQQEAGGWGEPALWSSAASSCSMSVSSYPSSARSSLDSGKSRDAQRCSSCSA